MKLILHLLLIFVTLILANADEDEDGDGGAENSKESSSERKRTPRSRSITTTTTTVSTTTSQTGLLSSSLTSATSSSVSSTAVLTTASQTASVTENVSTEVNTQETEQPDMVPIAVGVTLGALLLLALITVVLTVVICRRRRKSALARQSPTADLPPAHNAALPRSSNIYHEHAGHPTDYEEIMDIAVASPQTSSDAAVDNYEIPVIVPSAPLYAEPNRPPAAVPATSAEPPVYNDTSTTLVDNALYDAQRPTMTSSNVAEADGDVTDHTLIDNDLYERAGQGQGPQSSGSADASVPAANAESSVYNDTSTTLVDNPLYDVQQP